MKPGVMMKKFKPLGASSKPKFVAPTAGGKPSLASASKLLKPSGKPSVSLVSPKPGAENIPSSGSSKKKDLVPSSSKPRPLVAHNSQSQEEVVMDITR